MFASDPPALLRFKPGPEMQRALKIIKTRGSAHDNHEHDLQITDKGVIVKKA
jgi:KaiC/GvpD/RAD55 family RecA-like ATPase